MNRKVIAIISSIVIITGVIIGGVAIRNKTPNNYSNDKDIVDIEKEQEDDNEPNKEEVVIEQDKIKEDNITDKSKSEDKKEKVIPPKQTPQNQVSNNTPKKEVNNNTKNDDHKEILKPEPLPDKKEDKNKDKIQENKNDNINPSSVSSDKFLHQVEILIYKKVNEERSKVGASKLVYNDVMQKYARIKSQDMGDNNYFDHKDLQGKLITERMRKDGINYNAWGENIAYISGVSDQNILADQFVKNWMNSDGHRKNILSSNFSEIGVGVYKIGNKVYATQEFYK